MENSITIGKEAECEDFVIDIPAELPPVQWPECCIYRVPKLLRKVNKEAYTPKLVSIGPLHYGRKELRGMEMHKLRYFKDFFRWRMVKKSQKDLASIIAAKEETIRHCYSETSYKLTSSKEFVKMILLDSIFIIELFLKNSEEAKEKDYIQSTEWLKNGISNDLILLENQLPFFVLEDLHTSAFCDDSSSSPSHQQKGEQIKEHKEDPKKEINPTDSPFLKLSRSFFSYYDTDKRKECNIRGEVKHFTDLVRYFLCLSKLEPGTEIGKKQKKLEPAEPHHSYSATELDEGGLKFNGVEKRGLLDITFPGNKLLTYCPCFNLSWLLACLPCLKRPFPWLERNERFLEVPKFILQDSTERLLRNVMALEQCHYPSTAYICHYVCLLDDFIDTEKDVEILVNKKIIINMLGSNAAVVTLINKLGLEIVLVNKSRYSDIIQEINEYHDNPWNRIMATMKNVYFRDFWRGTATVVGLIILGITFWNFYKNNFKEKKD